MPRDECGERRAYLTAGEECGACKTSRLSRVKRPTGRKRNMPADMGAREVERNTNTTLEAARYGLPTARHQHISWFCS